MNTRSKTAHSFTLLGRISTVLLAWLGLGLLTGCGAGTGDTPAMTDGSLLLTDAATDELDMFEVDVTNVSLKRAGGTVVQLTTNKTRVDFAQLETLSELLVGSRIPVGIYESLSMTLDFANASVCLIGQTTPATVLDYAGSPITGEMDVTVSFAATSRPSIVINRNHLFVLDLDLNQSITVDQPANQVTFSPIATAEVDPLNPKPMFMNGTLTEVDLTASEITVERRGVDNRAIGTYTVSVSNTTVFQIDGSTSVGATGLAALNALGGNPRVYVQGSLSTTERKLNAVAIETGNGTPGNGQDFVIGHIMARDNGAGSNATLTVLGFSLDEPSGTRRFNTVHTVSVDLANTKVLRRGSGTSLTSDAINVGQRVAAFGSLTGTALDATATSGIVRMLDTSVWGTANSAPSGNTLALNVSRIGRRPIGGFNFTVGGNSQGTPTAYTVDVNGLDTTGISTGSKVRAIGSVNAVDVNGDDEFTAATLINHSTTATLLVTQWYPATAAAMPSITSTSLTLDVTDADVKVVGDGFGSSTLTTTPAPTLQPLLGIGVFRIVENGAVEVHLTFENFANALSTRIPASSGIFRVTAIGGYNAGTQTLSAIVVSVVLL